jgi:transcriptional regulator with XRE-family HTH domain
MTDARFVNYWASFVSSYRNLHNLTQDQLAERLNVSQQTVSRWEAGQQAPDPRSQATLRQVLGEADLSSKKNWIERVRRASGHEVLVDSRLYLLSVSAAMAQTSDKPPEQMIGKPYAKFLPPSRPLLVEKAVEDGFFEGAFSRLSYGAQLNYGHVTLNSHVDVWPVATPDAGVLMHVVMTFRKGPQNPGQNNLVVSDFVAVPNDFVGQAD